MTLIKKFLCGGCVIATIFLSAEVANAIEGRWRGDLTVQQTKLPLVFNFIQDADSTYCTIDSPMQSVTGMTTDVKFCNHDSIAIDIPKIYATFNGHISSSTISGIFQQRGYTFPLTLTREASPEELRPQTPRPPFPYTTIDTVFTARDGVALAGTLTLPDIAATGEPVVVMITGSGPQNRDEEIFDHKPFAVIADYLARNGIASFRYDDRGTALSGGDFKSADIEMFKSDAESAFTFAKSFFPQGKVGLLGHSEGGTIALMLATEDNPAFVITLAAATVNGKDLILAQNAMGLEKYGISGKQEEDALRLIALTFDDVISGKDYADIPIERYISDYNLEVNPYIVASIKQNLAATSGNYFRQLLSLNPSSWMVKIKCKVFAANGSLDKQVNCQENLAVVRNLIPDASVKEYPDLNHLFQHATTGEVTEYMNITETISPELLDDIAKFILNQ